MWLGAAGFAVLAIAYALTGVHLSHWGSVAALAMISLLFVGHALYSSLVASQRELIERWRP